MYTAPGPGEAAELRNEHGSAHRVQIEAKAAAIHLLICSHVCLFSHHSASLYIFFTVFI